MRFRGQVSQGLLLPIDQFPEIPSGMDLGMDVTDILGVRKWEIEEKVTTGGTVIGTLPIDVPHTDETRVQAEPDLIGDFAGLEYYITTKMDGSSHSVSLDEDGFHVTGHNYEYREIILRKNFESIMRIMVLKPSLYKASCVHRVFSRTDLN